MPIEDVVEFDLSLQLDIVPSLREHCDMDAILSPDMTMIYIDGDAFNKKKEEKRLRFSLAHEVGHFVLHKNIFQALKFQTRDEWITFIQNIPSKEYDWLQFHANEFAGRLLVPPQRLKLEFDKAIQRAEKAGFVEWDKSGEAAVEYIADNIAPVFGVSAQVIETRLRKEGFWK